MLFLNLIKNYTSGKKFLLPLLLISFVLVGCRKLNNDVYIYDDDKKESSSPEPTDPCSVYTSSPALSHNSKDGLADPLFDYQWYLKNTGQRAFARDSGTVGNDINWSTLSTEQKKGEGVIVAIVDSGLEIAHEDLAQNVVHDGSWDFICDDPNPTSLDTEGDHGTSVAGIIAARSENGIGLTGIAGRASLKGFNLVSIEAQTIPNYLAALGGSSDKPRSTDVSIFNQSFGVNTVHDIQIEQFGIYRLLEKQYKNGVNKLRDGKGAIYIKAAGNGFLKYAVNGKLANCVDASKFGISCQNANMDPINVVPYNIVVGAIDADGKHSSYSTTGSSLWISAPGGESGMDPNYANGDNLNAYKPAIVTTDQSGCNNGYNPHFIYNSFQGGKHHLNPDCNYTSTFNGSSSAAPIVSGVVALVLAANNELSWRDVKHILVKTAKQVDPTNKGASIMMRDTKYKMELGWITNKAGYKFHNYYGFGAVDAQAAVNLATGYKSHLGPFIEKDLVTKNNTNLEIPKRSFTGTTDAVNYPTDLKIEMVQIWIKLTHSSTGDLGIKLISPSGTESFLLNIFNGFSNDHDLDLYLASNTFYGESTLGEWRINVVDPFNNREKGKLISWGIKIYGHK